MLTRRVRLRLICLAAAAVAGSGCDDPTTVRGVAIDTTLIRSEIVDPDPRRTYESDVAEVVPVEALAALARGGLPIEVAWRPLDYRCEDVRGGRLTVQLTRADARMAAHGFSPGTGRLRCSETLVRYVVRRIGD